MASLQRGQEKQFSKQMRMSLLIEKAIDHAFSIPAPIVEMLSQYLCAISVQN